MSLYPVSTLAEFARTVFFHCSLATKGVATNVKQIYIIESMDGTEHIYAHVRPKLKSLSSLISTMCTLSGGLRAGDSLKKAQCEVFRRMEHVIPGMCKALAEEQGVGYCVRLNMDAFVYRGEGKDMKLLIDNLSDVRCTYLDGNENKRIDTEAIAVLYEFALCLELLCKCGVFIFKKDLAKDTRIALTEANDPLPGEDPQTGIATNAVWDSLFEEGSNVHMSCEQFGGVPLEVFEIIQNAAGSFPKYVFDVKKLLESNDNIKGALRPYCEVPTPTQERKDVLLMKNYDKVVFFGDTHGDPLAFYGVLVHAGILEYNRRIGDFFSMCKKDTRYVKDSCELPDKVREQSEVMKDLIKNLPGLISWNKRKNRCCDSWRCD